MNSTSFIEPIGIVTNSTLIPIESWFIPDEVIERSINVTYRTQDTTRSAHIERELIVLLVTTVEQTAVQRLFWLWRWRLS